MIANTATTIEQETLWRLLHLLNTHPNKLMLSITQVLSAPLPKFKDVSVLKLNFFMKLLKLMKWVEKECLEDLLKKSQ